MTTALEDGNQTNGSTGNSENTNGDCRRNSSDGEPPPPVAGKTDSPSYQTFESADLPPLTLTQKKTMAALTLVSLLNGSLTAVMIPFFPAEAADRGLSQTAISAVFSCYALAKLVLSPAVGRVAPAVGVTRLYTLGLAAAGTSTVVFGALQHIAEPRLFAAGCLLARLVEAAGTAAVSGCALTIIASQFGPRTSRAVALRSAASSVGLSVGPAIGSGLYTLGGFSLPFYVTGGTLLVMAALIHRLLPPLENCERQSIPYVTMVRTFCRSPQNWLCMLNVFMTPFIVVTFDTSLAPYAGRALGVTPSTLGLYFTVATTAYALTAYAWARVAESARRPHAFIGLGLLVVSASLLLAPPSPLLVGLQPRWWLLGLGMVLIEAALGGGYIPSFQLMLAAGRRAGLEDGLVTQAFVSSVLSTSFALGSVVGPPLGGAVVDWRGFPVMMTGLAGLTLIAALLNAGFALLAGSRREEKVGSTNAVRSRREEKVGITNAAASISADTETSTDTDGSVQRGTSGCVRGCR